MLRPRPSFAKFFNRRSMDHPEELVRHQAEEKRRWLRQRDTKRVIIDSVDANVLRAHRHKLQIGGDRGLQLWILFQSGVTRLCGGGQYDPRRRMHKAVKLRV